MYFKKIGQICGLSTLIIAVLVFVGWQFDIEVLKSVLPGFICMKANTAAGLFLFALCEIVLVFCKSRKIYLLVALALMIIGTFIGIATLFEYIFSHNLGIGAKRPGG